MKYRRFEADKDGRLTVYPSLYGPKNRPIRSLLRNLVEMLRQLIVAEAHSK